MTKEEAIKEAWGELNIYISGHINNNGWLDIKPTQYSRIYDKVDILKFSNHKHSIRPKRLSGIENNNGWIKIESEADLKAIHNVNKSNSNKLYVV
ncbi:hypothetical protein [Polluticaenibacter yanchengensis]|uniref:NUMOD4 domain-containing protein n=1 Tax=Polluticaenibacter yanchengensis TaxID=3014562 RepID=A0ABT4UIL4_9BACT|nr:hypothetical protein [Chitinophagaceae bacterium LY-5]